MKKAAILFLIGFLAVHAEGFQGVVVNPAPIVEHMNAVTYGNGIYVAVGVAGTIYSSADATVWTRRETAVLADLHAVAWTGSVFCVVGNNGALVTSPDGVSWTVQNSGTTLNLASVAAGGGKVVVGADGGRLLTSTDASLWNAVMGSPVIERISGLIYAGSRFVAVTEGGDILTSPEAVTWTRQLSPATGALSGVAYNSGTIVAVGADGVVLSSADGSTWITRRSGEPERLWSVTANGSGFVAVGTGGMTLASSDGLVWSANPVVGMPRIKGVTSGSAGLVGVSDCGVLLKSSDGLVWTGMPPGDRYNLSAVASDGSGTYVVVGTAGKVMSSADGLEWAGRSSPVNEDMDGVAYGSGRFVAVGANGQIISSTDGATWSAVASGVTVRLKGIRFAVNQFVAVGQSGLILRSSDGMAWTSSFVAGAKGDFTSVAYGNGLWVAVGQWGQIATSSDGSTWTLQPDSPDVKARWYDIQGVDFLNGRFVTATRFNTSFTSTDGLSWIQRSSAMVPGLDFHSIVSINGMFAAIGDAGIIQTSVDGIQWAAIARVTGARLRGGIFANNTILLVGDNGVVIRARVPAITVQSGNITLKPGESATLSVTATGDGPLAYQWYRGGTGDQSSPVLNATTASMTTPALAETTSYWVRVVDPNGSVVSSNTITVTVRGISIQPQTVHTISGQSATLSVTAGGVGTLNYQWYQGTSGDTSSPVPGATGNLLTLNPVPGGAAYWVRIVDNLGSFDSETAAIVVRNIHWIAYHAAFSAAGDAANTTSGSSKDVVTALRKQSDGSAAGSASIKYSWTGTYNVRTDNKTGWATGTDAYTVFNGFVGLGNQADNVSSAGGSTITISGLDPTRFYELAVYAGRDSSIFAATNLNAYVLQNAVVLSTAHSNGVTGSGTVASAAVGLGCRASGRVVRWTFQPLTSNVTLQTSVGGGAANSVIPQAVRLVEMTEVPVITATPASVSVPAGSSVNLQASVDGVAATLQWYHRSIAGNVTPVVGATSTVLAISGLSESAQYFLRATGSGGSVDSADATVIARRTYDVWAAGRGLAAHAENTDSDADGLSNLMEYVLGADPRISSAYEFPYGHLYTPGVFTMTFRKSLEIEGATVTPVTSASLSPGSWQSSGISQKKIGEADFVTEIWEASVPAVSARAFVRLQVTQP